MTRRVKLVVIIRGDCKIDSFLLPEYLGKCVAYVDMSYQYSIAASFLLHTNSNGYLWIHVEEINY